MASSLSPQPVAGGDNDLTRYQRSLTDLMGTSGEATQAAGAAALKAPIDYWTKILSGNKAEISAALEPELAASNAGFEQQRRTLDQYTPMGGGRSSAVMNLGSKKAQTNAGIISSARAGAAPQLAQAGLQEQSLGIEQLGQAIQAILSKMGINIQGGTSATFSSILQGIGAIV